MARTVGIGHQDFGQIIQNHLFYIDKTSFIREWWEGGDAVTLITRPKRFGKTLNMSMVEQFFSLEYPWSRLTGCGTPPCLKHKGFPQSESENMGSRLRGKRCSSGRGLN